MKTFLVALLLGYGMTLAAHAQFTRQPGLSEVTVIETRQGVQYVSVQTTSVTRKGKINVCTRAARGSPPPIGGVGCLSGKMQADGSFRASGKLDGDDETTTVSGKFSKNGKFKITRQRGDEDAIQIKGRSVIGGFSLTGNYDYKLGDSKVTGRISGTFHPAP